MSKNILLIFISILMVSLIVLLVMLFTNNRTVKLECGDAITKEETALKIGRALLEEHFYESFLNDDIELEAKEENGIWRVNSVVDRVKELEDGKITVIVGGGLYVEFRKDNGQVISIGIND